MTNPGWQHMLPSPLGRLCASTDGVAITALAFDVPPFAEAALPPPARALIERLGAALDAYFAGIAERFDLPLAPAGTPFQREVWNALLGIPYGETATYASIAVRIGRSAAVRAVGAANGRNPIAILIPCHRVVGSDGTLTGYAGGLDRKRMLLALEAPAPFARVAA